MSNEWYIQIFPCPKNKKSKQAFDIIEKKTVDKKEIGMCFDNLIFVQNCNLEPLKYNRDITSRQKAYVSRIFNYFVNVMKIGDTIYLKSGKKILYKAIIDSEYIFDINDFKQSVENGWFWPHRRKIKNIEKIYEIKPGYARMTLYKNNTK